MGILPALLLFCSASAGAADIQERLPDGRVVHADLRQGELGRPAVLVLHGFMTTQYFNTVQSLVDELAASGYTVLAPTLSLGIHGRRAGLPCDAVHTHTFDQDVAEIAWWVEWLARRGHTDVLLVGHSTGSLHLLAYAAERRHPTVRKLIATSLVYFGQDHPRDRVEAEMRLARRRLAEQAAELGRYTISFCNGSFVAPPEAYLSYMRWGRSRVLDALRAVDIPVEVIMGSADQRFSPEWIAALADAGAEVQIIEGAGHFFDATHEFELLDRVRACAEHYDSGP